MIAADDIPFLPRGVRLHFDTVRDTWVLLAPERVLKLDAVAAAVLAELDGKRTFGEITAALAAGYNAPEAQIAVARASDEPVAIVGMACRFPGASSSPDAFWGFQRMIDPSCLFLIIELTSP